MNAKALGLVVAALAALAALFIVLRPDPAPAPADRAAVPAAADPAVPPREVLADITVQDGRRVSGPALIAATQGQVLRLRVSSNRADEMHLHGYDRTLKLAAGAPAELTLELALSGRFEIELHHAHSALAVLEVQPAPTR